jgi:hypothetical protein
MPATPNDANHPNYGRRHISIASWSRSLDMVLPFVSARSNRNCFLGLRKIAALSTTEVPVYRIKGTAKGSTACLQMGVATFGDQHLYSIAVTATDKMKPKPSDAPRPVAGQ